MPQTPNHGYNVPNKGDANWHRPLNANFRQYDTDIEVRDADANTGNYQPTQGAKFLATDTGVVYEGDGSNWVPTLAQSRYVEPASSGGAGNLVAGHPVNTVASGIDGATIGGGGEGGNNPSPNQVAGEYGTIAGGRSNSIASFNGTIAGGGGNAVTGAVGTVAGGGGNAATGSAAAVGGGGGNAATARNTTVGGGDLNTASGAWATVGGGLHNQASGIYATVAGGGPSDRTNRSATQNTSNAADSDFATIGGGGKNVVSGQYGTIPGGRNNTVDGDYGFAAGRGATANGAGTFVWGDSSSNGVTATQKDEFKVQAGGGAVIFSASDHSTGVNLAPGSGSWSAWSTRSAKENVEPIDPADALEGVRALDVSTWNYTGQDESVRHMGPMAEDFYEEFGLGGDRRRISGIDADGVAFAAIQGLSERLDGTEAKIERQRDRIDALEVATERKDDRLEELAAENDLLRDRLTALEARVDELDDGAPSAATSDD